MQRGGVAYADHEGDAVGMRRSRGSDSSCERISEKVLPRFRFDRNKSVDMSRFQFGLESSAVDRFRLFGNEC